MIVLPAKAGIQERVDFAKAGALDTGYRQCDETFSVASQGYGSCPTASEQACLMQVRLRDSAT
jgi:hypothetical protein